MYPQASQHIVLVVTGGIAAYKAPDVVRRLRERGCEVRVVMSDAARAFITPLTMQAVSGSPVYSGLLDETAEAAMGHIELARWAERVLVAPATADFMARLAHGLAGDLPGALCLATAAPVVLAPAMNQQMWLAAATQANVRLLAERGVRLLGPGDGSQACGEVGPGRMLEPLQIVEALLGASTPAAMRGLQLLVTAGPTREALDPVRYISNHSSGKMGYAIARAARAAGAEVVLVSGPTALPVPEGVTLVAVTSATQMHDAVLARAAAAHIFIAAAAVADYRPVQAAPSKLKKHAEHMRVELVRNPDILAAVAALPAPPFTVGFAAETDEVERHARDKLERKRLDMIAANRVGLSGSGFDADDNALHLYWAGGSCELPLASKQRLAAQLLGLVTEHYRARHPAQDS